MHAAQCGERGFLCCCSLLLLRIGGVWDTDVGANAGSRFEVRGLEGQRDKGSSGAEATFFLAISGSFCQIEDEASSRAIRGTEFGAGDDDLEPGVLLQPEFNMEHDQRDLHHHHHQSSIAIKLHIHPLRPPGRDRSVQEHLRNPSNPAGGKPTRNGHSQRVKECLFSDGTRVYRRIYDYYDYDYY
ncbi:hypothetical protein EJ05DRAFT_482343 [Pseudovirgaria hyperparasitica]|uniref:Uncharacterized protein n=1 Tax=Pseudovirgaria hyperparasitica TaxID=470096 RepID=A0A6A6WMV2_9PEZI|nr:uncharacterized protein EJ05DRAFT_482343 [Pseudovirgaria hyperparasitica]KAF2763555.1 hypothetical protein EJ05DRAFT_482343 [Pseudovirgaria hyperparasitica]